MPTIKRLNLTLNANDIEQLNDIRQKFTESNRSETYSYVDVIRILLKYGQAYPYAVIKERY